MGIDISQLGPAAQEQAIRKLAQMNLEKMKRQESEKEAAKQKKYRNVSDERATEDGNTIKFDSKKEARRFDELMILLNAGAISDLRLQADFTLQEAYTLPNGNRVRAIRYKADFTYMKDGKLVVEDVKSSATKTRVYAIKKKMMLEKFGIEVTEI